MSYNVGLHHIMVKGRPYSELVVRIVEKIEEKKNPEFSIRDFSRIDSTDWRKVVAKLNSNGFIIKAKRRSGSRPTIYRDQRLCYDFWRWCEKYDWREYLY
ncbi:MAG: hypothetical protein ACXQTL_02230 [Methanosarcinales archaeon]